MKKQKLQVKKVMPLLASIALLSGPILLVTACDSSINRYNTALPSDQQKDIILDFVGVNFNITAQSQFSAAITNPDVMKAVQKQIEGIMAHQEFFNFFTKKLGYSDDKANATFQSIKDNLGLNLLANSYFAALNSDTDFDGSVYKNNNLIFQTDNWYLNGTNKFDYSASDFYKQHDPNKIFGSDLYTADLNEIIKVATYADDSENYNKLMATSGFNSDQTYTGQTTQPVSPPSYDTSQSIDSYQDKLQRFKWLLRFRYSQYYVSQIEPQLNQDLFTMANILDTVLKTTRTDSKTNILIQPGTYPDQLQSWTGNNWSSNYRYTWDYTTSPESAQTDQSTWSNAVNPPADAPNPNIIDANGNLNPNFLKKFTGGDQHLKNAVDPIFGGNGYMLKTDSRDYNTQATSPNTTTAQWLKNTNSDPTSNYWVKNNKASFAYTAPIYFIDDILNLNFNWGNDQNPNQAITIDQTQSDNQKIISQWTSGQQASQSPFSKFLRNDGPITANYAFMQNLKWNLFWQMLYSIATQNSDFPNTNGKTNYTAAGKSLYPKYIKKENVYSNEFWNQISANYS